MVVWVEVFGVWVSGGGRFRMTLDVGWLIDLYVWLWVREYF